MSLAERIILTAAVTIEVKELMNETGSLGYWVDARDAGGSLVRTWYFADEPSARTHAMMIAG